MRAIWHAIIRYGVGVCVGGVGAYKPDMARVPVEDDGGLGRRDGGFLGPKARDRAPHLIYICVCVCTCGSDVRFSKWIGRFGYIGMVRVCDLCVSVCLCVSPTPTPTHLDVAGKRVILPGRRLLVLDDLLDFHVVGHLARVAHACCEWWCVCARYFVVRFLSPCSGEVEERDIYAGQWMCVPPAWPSH